MHRYKYVRVTQITLLRAAVACGSSSPAHHTCSTVATVTARVVARRAYA